MERTLYLVRHGALGEPARGRFIGQTDLELSREGIRHAEALAAWFASQPLTAIYCSDLTRTRQTAQRIAAAHRLTPRADAALREIALGHWENQPRKDIAARFPEQFAARGRDIMHFRPPEGESFADCLQRVEPCVSRILADTHGPVVVVAHAGVNRLLLSRALGLSLPLLMEIPQDYGCMNILRIGQDRSHAQRINFVPFGATSGQAGYPREAVSQNVTHEARISRFPL